MTEPKSSLQHTAKDYNYLIDNSITVKSIRNQGLYFLISKGEIVYIGQSNNVLARIGAHLQNKTFDSYTVINIPFSLDFWEAYYIISFSPKHNKSVPVNDYLKTLSMIKKEKGIGLVTIKKYIKNNRLSEFGKGHYFIDTFKDLKK